ncbi:cupin domain-containing protein [Candidatus Dojkabacteria bacterium]|nr:cupin domain-containing protein [Candidatus Dojkabacteria bacterium]
MDSSIVKVVNVAEKLSLFKETWNPKIVGELNDDKVQLVKILGEFVWHHHDNEDEFFMVLSGELIVHFRDRDVIVKEGEFVIIPKKLEHMTEAKVETALLYIEPKAAINTGNVTDVKTAINQDKI